MTPTDDWFREFRRVLDLYYEGKVRAYQSADYLRVDRLDLRSSPLHSLERRELAVQGIRGTVGGLRKTTQPMTRHMS